MVEAFVLPKVIWAGQWVETWMFIWGICSE